MKIVFWSVYHGQSRTTANMLALSAYIALNSEQKNLIVHNQLQHSALEFYLGLKQDGISNKGIDPVMVQLKNMSLNSKEIHEYTTSVLKNNRYDVLQGSKHSHDSIHQEFTDIFRASIDLADKYYDNVFVDASAGVNNGILRLLDNADLIIINVNQNKYVLDETHKFYQTIEKYHNKVHVLIGSYDDNSKHTLRNIKSKYKFNSVYKLSENPVYANYLNNSKVLEFVHVNKETNKTDLAYNIMKDLEEIAKGIFNFSNGG